MQLFAYFGEGNFSALKDLWSEDCTVHHGGNPTAIPFAKPYQGKNGVVEFFQTIGSSITVSNLVPSNFREEGNEVIHDFHVEATVNANGRSYKADVTYVWTFNEQGQICKHHSFGDFAEAEAAFLGF